MKSFLIRRLALIPFVLIGAFIWLPNMYRIWLPKTSQRAVEPAAIKMANSLEGLWGQVSDGSGTLRPLRQMNPEWDFMGRTFFILAEANLALRVPDRESQCLDVIDSLITNTLAVENKMGASYFLMSYHSAKPWQEQPPRSIFVDGEIALTLGARRMVRDDGKWQDEFRQRISKIEERMNRGSVFSAESYPDECWTFCNSVALAALRMSDYLDGTNHEVLIENWLAMAKQHLLDQETGMLIAAFTYKGEPHPAGDRPEGTTTWLVNHMLQVVDPEFARDQYHRSHRHLRSTFLGFGYSKEWPSWDPTNFDIDSGLVVPGLEASASASGLALVGAAAFDDERFYRQLRASLDFFAFPKEDETQLSYEMAGAIGNPVLFYSMVEGPLWERLQTVTGSDTL